MAETQAVAEPIGVLIPSGHCSFPVTADPQSSHDRCARNGGGSRANPKKIFTPCPCSCHYGEEFECGGCGRPIVECLAWPLDADGDMHYTHIDDKGWATGEECGTTARGFQKQEDTEPTPEREKDCIRCGDTFTGNSDNPVCPKCTAEDEPEDDFSDLGDEEEDDGFADLDAMMAEFDID